MTRDEAVRQVRQLVGAYWIGPGGAMLQMLISRLADKILAAYQQGRADCASKVSAAIATHDYPTWALRDVFEWVKRECPDALLVKVVEQKMVERIAAYQAWLSAGAVGEFPDIPPVAAVPTLAAVPPSADTPALVEEGKTYGPSPLAGAYKAFVMASRRLSEERGETP